MNGLVAVLVGLVAECVSGTYFSPGRLNNVMDKGCEGRQLGQVVLIDTFGFYLLWAIPLVSGRPQNC